MMDISDQSISDTREGVIMVRDFRRMGSHQQREDWAFFNEVTGLPWEPVPGQEGIQIKSSVRIPGEEQRPILPPTQVQTRDYQARDAQIRKTDISKYGPTMRCKGCEALMTDARRADGTRVYRVHNNECKERFKQIWQHLAISNTII